MKVIKLKDEILDEKLLMEMAKIGEVEDKTIYVRANEGPISHFHIVDSNSLGRKFHTCVQIVEPKYFHHTGKEDALNSREIKELIKFLNSSCEMEEFNNGTNWRLIRFIWNINNPKFRVDKNIEMPDYTLLNK